MPDTQSAQPLVIGAAASKRGDSAQGGVPRSARKARRSVGWPMTHAHDGRLILTPGTDGGLSAMVQRTRRPTATRQNQASRTCRGYPPTRVERPYRAIWRCRTSGTRTVTKAGPSESAAVHLLLAHRAHLEI